MLQKYDALDSIGIPEQVITWMNATIGSDHVQCVSKYPFTAPSCRINVRSYACVTPKKIFTRLRECTNKNNNWFTARVLDEEIVKKYQREVIVAMNVSIMIT